MVNGNNDDGDDGDDNGDNGDDDYGNDDNDYDDIVLDAIYAHESDNGDETRFNLFTT